jgi:hypothetical protein
MAATDRAIGQYTAGAVASQNFAIAVCSGVPGSGQPVGAAAGHQDRLLRCDLPEKRLHRATLVAPAPGRDRDLVRVHRQCQGGRAAVLPQRAYHRTKLGM